MTRWKVMAGVLTVGLGGLAAVAGPCPKPDDAPKLPAGEKVSPPPVEVPPPAPASLPPLPVLPPVSAEPAKLPPVPPPAPVAQKPAPALPPIAPPVVVPAGGVMPPAPSGPATPPPMAGGPAPALPPMAPPAGLPVPAVPAAAPDLPPAPAAAPASPPAGFDLPPAPAPTAPSKAGGLAPDVPAVAPTVGLTPAAKPVAWTPELDVPPAKPTAAAVVPAAGIAPAVASKYRIVLRVGEGDPVFEVRHGDDLVMKVTSEKVDVKSPEKGAGLSAVTASGKVRFVGFGSEGTCDTLAFLAGTGEVAMSGGVKVLVRDKIGRVESELTADQMKYKIDTTALPGSIKP